jgi:hypothetical protein
MTLAATISTPIPPSPSSSARSLEEVGALTVLEAMVEQRRRSSGNLPAVLPAGATRNDADAVATQRRERLDPDHDVFQKIR